MPACPATQVADPFHVIKLANERIDDTRRRIQNEILGHRGRRDDPLYRARRLLTMAEERLGEKGAEKMRGLLDAGDPYGQVAVAWEAKEAVRELYGHQEPGPRPRVDRCARRGSDRQDPSARSALARRH